MTKKALKTAAIITIRKPGAMTVRGRRDIAQWLRKTAAHLLRHGDNCTNGTFTARFIYGEKA